MPAIGVSTPRRDSEPKVRGATRFAADLPVVGLLHARLVVAHEAHALISSINIEDARTLPGVVAVITAADLPLVGSGGGRMHEPLAREEVVYAGQPVALVVAESEAIAADAVERVQLELEPLEPVLDLETAIRRGAPPARARTAEDDSDTGLGDVHASVSAGHVDDQEELSKNVLATARLASGDVEAELAAS